MEHLLPRTTHYDPWSPYHENGVDHAGDSYMTTHHHMNGEQGSYQHYESFHHPQGYDIAQNEFDHHTPLVSSDASMSYWQTAQVPTLASGAPLSALSSQPVYYPPSCYDSRDLSSTEHQHTATEDHFQPVLPSVCGTTYGTTSQIYPEPDTALAGPSSAPPHHAPAPQPIIAHDQSESGHDLMPQGTAVRPAWYEGSASFQPQEPSYSQIRKYEESYATPPSVPCHYAPAPIAKEDQQPSYMAAASPPAPAPAPDAQAQYIAPPTLPGPKAESPDRLHRPKSPMDHLPYPEDLAEGRCRHSSAAAAEQSPSPASTPAPLSPVLQTLTFITYPETGPRMHRDGRGSSGGDSDDLGDDDEWGSSLSRRGRRGKKQPKKDPFLACFFCRGRKIACHPRNEGGEDRTCTQCAKRHLPCHYPLTSRRGQRKPHDSTASDLDGALGDVPVSVGATVRASSQLRARAPSKLSTSSSSSSYLVSAA